MDALTAKPQLLKQANLSSIRRVVKSKFTATRLEISNETKISSTTVRSLLTEMIKNGEIESIGYDESSGGRKAERYKLKPNRYYSVAFCILNNKVYCLLVNVCGEILETSELEIHNENFESEIVSFLDNLILKKEIKAIGIGVPGIVHGGIFLREDKHTKSLSKINLGNNLAQRYGIPVIMENDMKAATIGFSRRQKTDNGDKIDHTVYLNFEEGCVSAGIIAEGRVIRGYNNFAGELSLIKIENGKTLNEYLSEPMDEMQYVTLVTNLVSFICGILNPKYIVLGGHCFRASCAELIKNTLKETLQENMAAEIVHPADLKSDYCEGMAYLAAEKMFDDIQFIKE